MTNEKFKMNNINRFIAKTKVNTFVCLLILFYVMLMSGCSNNGLVEGGGASDESNVKEINQWFPALWLNGPEYTYQPLYANKTKLSIESRDTNIVYFTSIGLPFTIESNDPVTVNYLITRGSGELIENGSVESRIVQSDQSHLFDIVPMDFNHYNVGETYKLEVTLTINGQDAYYYMDLFFNDVDGNSKSVEKVYDYLKKDLKAQEVSLLNIPRFWINVKEDGTALVRSEFTGATRLEEGFDYRDYIKVFAVDIINGSINQVQQYSVDKQRYFYSKENQGWTLGQQIFIGEDTSKFTPYMRKLISTQDKEYQLIYSDYELFRYNEDKEELKEIYRLDAFDSDYIYDEYQKHKINVLNIEENGDVYFAVLGYIHDGSESSQKNGIGFYKYTKNKLINLDFLEKEGTISQLESYLKNNSYYNVGLNRLYFLDKQILYMFDLVTGDFNYIDAYLKASLNTNTGILSWQGHDNKFNGTVYVVDLNKKIIEVKDLYQTGVYKRILADSEHYIFVGDYYVEDTYEALNGRVIYPFSQVNVYDFNGKVIASYKHLDYGENIFFSDVYFDVVTNQWKCDLIERQIKREEISKDSRITFVQTDESVVLEESELSKSMVKTFLNKEEFRLIDYYPEGVIQTKNKKQDIIFLNKATMSNGTSSKIQFIPYPKEDVYKIVDSKGDVLYTSTLTDALQVAKEKRDYKIYLSKYLDHETGNDELIFDSASLLTSQYLDAITILPQRPELPRGCEVASLSILLDYYLDEAPGKIELANELKSSSMEYKVIDGFVNYSNMHYEFAGSMSDTSKPGLGVYIEPIKRLAEQYIDFNPTNITGISFEQLLTFVSKEQPVLIIIPNRYQAVEDYAKEVWKTSSGYMEVTYQEHSVVVMGFDENYVYYSDPSKGIIDKKSLQSFKNAWESMGNQGLVILE